MASAIGEDPDAWQYWDGPDIPPDGTCTGTQELSITNATPSNGAEDVVINSYGVNTSADVTVTAGICIANVTFQWLNYSMYFGDWIVWAMSQDWFDYDNISWATEPSYTNNSYWFNYSNWSEISNTENLWANNDNVSCYTQNDWTTQWFDWRIYVEYTCGGVTFNQTCYYYFTATECPVNYVYPPSPNGTVCPCCDSLCINVTNEQGHPMNLVFYANDTMNETFYIINKYINETNGSYCFCTCGHVDDIFYPLKYNETYHWYVNVTDTITGISNDSAMFQFTTMPDPSLCPCSYEEITELIADTDTIRDDAWLIGLILVFFVVGIVLAKRRS